MSQDKNVCTVSPALKDVRLEGGFWEPRLDANRKATLPAIYRQLDRTGRLEALRLTWKPGMPNPPHVFWDSDVAKWVEAAAYSLCRHPSAARERQIDAIVDALAAAQQPDGYLNTYYTQVEPEKRWTNLRDQHELYCAGHLMEAAVAYFQATGKRRFLEVMCRNADYIADVFGTGPGQMRGYPGHPELELALMRLHAATGNERYLKLASYFVEERGQTPCWFDVEAAARGESTGLWPGEIDWTYVQAHLPVREQLAADGHAVRACYLYAGMADVATATGDEGLMAACRRLFDSIVTRRLYIHGGIGSAHSSERFTFDYDLPNEEAYAETCAAISLMFFAQRMLQQDRLDRRYSDVMEQALYNNVLAGVSLDGRHFFYDNVLAAYPERNRFSRRNPSERQPFFDCACCPPNLARLLESLGAYAYSQNADLLAVHLYLQSRIECRFGEQTVVLRQQTDYPWSPEISLMIEQAVPVRFSLALRIPAWCREAAVRVNGEVLSPLPRLKNGYLFLSRVWRAGDRVDLTLEMPVERVSAHPSVRHNAGRVALQRGPLVYCLESADNGEDLNALELAADPAFRVETATLLSGKMPVIRARAHRLSPSGWKDRLYRNEAPASRSCRVTAVPYFAWGNRGRGEMLIWVRQRREAGA